MPSLFHHMLHDSASRDPGQEALVAGDLRLSYGSMAQQVSALAQGLRELGVTRGDRVAVHLEPSAALPVALYAVSQAGGVFVPIHHGMLSDQVAHILQDSGAVALISDGRRWRALERVLPKIPSLTFAVVHDPVEATPARPTYDFEVLSRKAANTEDDAQGATQDLCAIVYTSGSTGRPKGVMLSHSNLLAGAAIVSRDLKITKRDRLLAALPLAFDAGLYQLTTAILQGGTTVMVKFRLGAEIVRALAGERITGLAGVPSLWTLLTQPSSGLGRRSVSALRYITNTGGALPPAVLARLRTLLPDTEVVLMYGLTEAFRSTYLPPEQLATRPTSIGKAIPDTEIFVLNEAGDRCDPGDVGELVHHGPTVSQGYWGHPALTASLLRPHPFPVTDQAKGVRVCYSGDLVRRDEEGFLYFVGRRDNQIKSAGFRISATEVEEVVGGAEGVCQAAVVGVPDAVLGQHLVAFVVAREEAGVDPHNVLDHCAGALPRHMVPKRVELVSALPATASGKVDYPKLRDRAVRPLAVAV